MMQQQQPMMQQQQGGFVGNLTVLVHKAENLPRNDLLSRNDPYLKVRLDSQRPEDAILGKVIKKGAANPVFEDQFQFQLQGIERELLIEIWDKNMMKDDKIGYLLIPLSDLIQRTAAGPTSFGLEKSHDRGDAGAVYLQAQFVGQTPFGQWPQQGGVQQGMQQQQQFPQQQGLGMQQQQQPVVQQQGQLGLQQGGLGMQQQQPVVQQPFDQQTGFQQGIHHQHPQHHSVHAPRRI